MTVVECLQAVLQQKEDEVAVLRRAVAAFSEEDVQRALALASSSAKRTDYRDLGVTAAAKRFLREKAPEPQDTRSIADALLNRGLRTNSKNFIATVYATLNNGKGHFKRTKDGRWELVGP